MQRTRFFVRFLFAAPESLPFKQITKDNRKLKSYDDNDINMYWSLCRELLDPINLAIDTAERQVIMKNDEADDIHIEYENYINFESQKMVYIILFKQMQNEQNNMF